MQTELLLATDLLEGSHRIAMRAKMIAKQLGANLSIIHVVETPLTAQYAQALGFAELISPSTEEAKTVLMTLADELGIPQQKQYVYIGRAANSIIKAAKELEIDAIIIGAHAHTALPSFLGTTANTILHKAHCDVITLRPEFEQKA